MVLTRYLGVDVDIQRERVLQALEDLGLCHLLTDKEQSIYGEKGYLFPSLLPEGDQFIIPISPDEDQTAIK